MSNLELRQFLITWQFWLLELQFAAVVVTTILAAPRLAIRRSVVAGGLALAAGVLFLTSTVAPRTSRIYYDEQIYQDVARNLSDLRRAQMCNDGTVEYGRLQCFQGEYNKEPNGYAYLLSIIYRTAGVSEAAAYRFNNVVAAAAVLVTVMLADLLFGSFWIAMLSGLMLAIMPMQLTWANSAAAEPSAALFCGAAALAAVHFARTRTPAALAWTVAVSGFAMTLRPECILIVPIVVLAVALLAPGEFARRPLWIAAAAGAVASTVTVLHMIAVWNEGWGTTGPSMSWRYAATNFPVNFWFYFADERFPAVCGAAAVLGLLSRSRIAERLWLFAYFLAFWVIFVFFYAGSYNYGADVRYSLMSNVPIAILAGAGLGSLGAFVVERWPARWTERRVCGLIATAVVAHFLVYLPLVRATGEEAWAARADVTYARSFAQNLPPNSFVLTQNPSMFHIWNVAAGQMSMVITDRNRAPQLFARFTGGVYLHWNFWCNVQDPVQTKFCHTAIDMFPHDVVETRQEREYKYVLYRLQPREDRPPSMLRLP